MLQNVHAIDQEDKKKKLGELAGHDCDQAVEVYNTTLITETE